LKTKSEIIIEQIDKSKEFSKMSKIVESAPDMIKSGRFSSRTKSNDDSTIQLEILNKNSIDDKTEERRSTRR
jgi:hypothetical protein